ncbi:hypothetical protein ANN_14903 [Periplaneta americana]|uniref:DUF4817 domain-containing protein n=1 Tax=Periplaneta americana TaxID=6978 RepID=A0ABQ8SYP8_PERAM|nr:hypothetical protein ANN_14903 [Periplaneta americana]
MTDDIKIYGNIKIGDLSFEKMDKFKYLGATITNINYIHEQIKRRIKIWEMLVIIRLRSKSHMKLYRAYELNQHAAPQLLGGLNDGIVVVVHEEPTSVRLGITTCTPTSATRACNVARCGILRMLFNDVVSNISFFNVDGIGDNEMVFGEMRPRIRHRLPDISLTVGENLTKNPTRSLPSKETLRGHSDSSFRGEGYIQCCVGVRLCDMYSNQELAEIHFMYGKADGNAALARRLYQERYPQRQCPDRKTFVRLHYRLCEYGKFDSPGLGRGGPRSTTPEVQEEILEAVNMTSSISTRRVALQVNVPHATVWRLLKEYVSIVSLSFATCTGPVTSRFPCTS